MKFPIAPESMKADTAMEKGGDVLGSSCMRTGSSMGFTDEEAVRRETIALHSESISTWGVGG